MTKQSALSPNQNNNGQCKSYITKSRMKWKT